MKTFETKQRKSPVFIFEGIDGSGKTTCINKLSEVFKKQYPLAYDQIVVDKYSNFQEKEDLKYKSLGSETETKDAFFAKSLMALYNRTIKNVQEGKIVFLDRSHASFFSYLHETLHNGLQPHVSCRQLSAKLNTINPMTYIYFKPTKEVFLKNLKNRGAIDNLDVYCQTHYDSITKRYEQFFTRAKLIDYNVIEVLIKEGTPQEYDSNTEFVYKKMIDLLERKWCP